MPLPPLLQSPRLAFGLADGDRPRVCDRMYSLLQSEHVSHGKADSIKIWNRSEPDTDSTTFLTNILKPFGCQIRKELNDGSCGPRVIANGIFGDSERHLEVREHVVEYLIEHRIEFETQRWDAETFDAYIERMSKFNTWVDYLFMIAAARAYGVNIVIVGSNGYMSMIPSDPLAGMPVTAERVLIAVNHTDVHFDSGSPPGEQLGDRRPGQSMLHPGCLLQSYRRRRSRHLLSRMKPPSAADAATPAAAVRPVRCRGILRRIINKNKRRFGNASLPGSGDAEPSPVTGKRGKRKRARENDDDEEGRDYDGDDGRDHDDDDDQDGMPGLVYTSDHEDDEDDSWKKDDDDDDDDKGRGDDGDEGRDHNDDQMACADLVDASDDEGDEDDSRENDDDKPLRTTRVIRQDKPSPSSAPSAKYRGRRKRQDKRKDHTRC